MNTIEVDKLKHIRQGRNITLKQLSEKSGLTKSDLFEIENNKGGHSKANIDLYIKSLEGL